MVVNKSATLSDTVTRKLLAEIQEGLYDGEKMLPPEKEIAQRMGVSRPVVRDALSRLEREGFVSRKHGIGTVINYHVLKLFSRMDMEKDFLDLVIDAGFEPTTRYVKVDDVPASEAEASLLKIETGTPLILVERLITADGEPAIFCRDYFAKDLIEGLDCTREDLTIPVFYFLREFCGKDVHLDLAEVRAAAADSELASIMDIAEDDPVLELDEVGYDILGTPLTCSHQYYAGDKLQHTILQKRI